MLDAMIWVIRNGTGLISKICVMAMVIGPISRTVVTLSKKAERTAVMMTNSTMMRQGSPFAILADLIAMNSKMPEFFTTATNSIIPIRTPTVLKSI